MWLTTIQAYVLSTDIYIKDRAFQIALEPYIKVNHLGIFVGHGFA